MMKCPCHSGKSYTECCGPYHEGALPPTPTALMRSRYSAYALCKIDYIIATTHSEHPDTQRPKAAWTQQIKTFCENTSFTGLTILEAEGPYVTFRAELGAQGSFIEKSEFEKEQGAWRYKRALEILSG